MDLNIIVEGPDAEEVAGELAGLIKDTFDFDATPVLVKAESTRSGDKWDPAVVGAVAAAGALILGIPASLVAVMDLVDRIKKKEKTDKLIQGTKTIRHTYSETVIRIQKPDGTLIDLHQTKAETIMDLAGKEK